MKDHDQTEYAFKNGFEQGATSAVQMISAKIVGLLKKYPENTDFNAGASYALRELNDEIKQMTVFGKEIK